MGNKGPHSVDKLCSAAEDTLRAPPDAGFSSRPQALHAPSLAVDGQQMVTRPPGLGTLVSGTLPAAE